MIIILESATTEPGSPTHPPPSPGETRALMRKPKPSLHGQALGEPELTVASHPLDGLAPLISTATAWIDNSLLFFIMMQALMVLWYYSVAHASTRNQETERAPRAPGHHPGETLAPTGSSYYPPPGPSLRNARTDSGTHPRSQTLWHSNLLWNLMENV